MVSNHELFLVLVESSGLRLRIKFIFPNPTHSLTSEDMDTHESWYADFCIVTFYDFSMELPLN